jgi:tRNA dimethylallyltransferase
MPFPDPPALPQEALIPLVVILGPTAVGKTETAILLAEGFNGEVVSADSRLFYMGMDIGTAKPSLAQRARVPHHLIDIATPDQVLSLAIFQHEAQRIIKEISLREHLPFLVGGTGQYIHAVVEGWTIPEVRPDPRLRQALENWAKEIGPFELYNRLAILDPSACEHIQPQNVRRTIRALEVILSSGRLFSAQRQRLPSPYRVLLLGLKRPRQELYTRIDDRIDAMFRAGLVDEVKNLLNQGYSPDLPTLSAIGYRETVAYLKGEISLEEAIVQMKQRTRIFVRRQANWFKETDQEITWFEASSQTLSQMTNFIQQWLNVPR